MQDHERGRVMVGGVQGLDVDWLIGVIFVSGKIVFRYGKIPFSELCECFRSESDVRSPDGPASCSERIGTGGEQIGTS